MPSSPLTRQLRRLARARASWKTRNAAKQQAIRRLRTTVRDLKASRDHWKQRAQTLQAQAAAAAAFTPLSLPLTATAGPDSPGL